MSLLMCRRAQDAALPRAYELESSVEKEIKRLTQFEPSCGISSGVSGSAVSVDLPDTKDGNEKGRDFVYQRVKMVVGNLARYAGAKIISESKGNDYVTFKLDKRITQDSAAQDYGWKSGDYVKSHLTGKWRYGVIVGESNGKFKIRWQDGKQEECEPIEFVKDVEKTAKDSAAQDADYPAKYRIGQKGYEISGITHKPTEINGERVICTIKEIHNKGLKFNNEAQYWCNGRLEKSGANCGNFPVSESKFKPL